MYVGGALASMVRAYLFVLAGQRMVAHLRKKLFGKIVTQDIAFFDVNRLVIKTLYSVWVCHENLCF